MNSEAEFLGLSPATTKKYLDKMTSSTGYLKTREIYHDSIIEFKDEIYKKSAKMELENKGFVFE